MADGFVWYELVTNDIKKAVTFYRKVVGWDIRDSGFPGMQYWLFAKNGKDVGGIMAWADTDAPAGMKPEWMAHIHTAHLDDELKSLTADGGTIIKPAQVIPNVGRFAVVTDPQKAKYLLFEPASSYLRESLGQMEDGNCGWHELLTSDAEAAFAFYSKHYGWQKDYAHDMGGMGLYQTFRTTTSLYTGGMMTLKKAYGSTDPNAPDLPPHWHYYFLVDDIEAAAERVTAAGGKLVGPPMDVPGGSRILQAHDDQGCEFCLMRKPQQ